MPKRKYTDEQMAEALALYAEHGTAVASHRCDIPGNTIRSWAQRRGLNTASPAPRAAGAEASTKLRMERRKRSLEERRAVLVEKLGELAELSVDWTIQAVAEGAELNMRDVVGSFTRAIHDLQLLSGGATARGEHRELAGVEDVRKLRDDLAERRANKAVGE